MSLDVPAVAITFETDFEFTTVTNWTFKNAEAASLTIRTSVDDYIILNTAGPAIEFLQALVFTVPGIVEFPAATSSGFTIGPTGVPYLSFDSVKAHTIISTDQTHITGQLSLYHPVGDGTGVLTAAQVINGVVNLIGDSTLPSTALLAAEFPTVPTGQAFRCLFTNTSGGPLNLILGADQSVAGATPAFPLAVATATTREFLLFFDSATTIVVFALYV